MGGCAEDVSQPCDLLVIGGGMAGLTAAASAAREGGSVVLVDRGPELGGSAQLAGFFWTAPTVEVMREVNPNGDPALGSALVDGFENAVDWIRSLGVEVGPAVTVLRYGRGHRIDVSNYLSRCEQLVRRSGGEILKRARGQSLLTDDGRVCGAEIALADGTVRTVRARRTLLATGGFQGDPALLGEHVHPRAGGMALRSNPWSRGDGLRLGLGAGAAFGRSDAGFYGHLVPAGVALDDPALFVDLALYYSEHALLFNVAGERFVDETVGDHLTAMALTGQPEARGLLVADAAVHREWITTSYVEGGPALDKFERCSRLGARLAVADSVEEFDLIPEEWGYPGPAIRAAIEKFNAKIEAGRDPYPGRAFDRRPIGEPPFYVVEAAPAITFTMGGLLIDPAGRVRSAEGGTVPGLLCAGADAGGLYAGAYAGGLAPAVVFGLAAARTALTDS